MDIRFPYQIWLKNLIILYEVVKNEIYIYIYTYILTNILFWKYLTRMLQTISILKILQINCIFIYLQN